MVLVWLSQFYFGKPLQELDVPAIASLVGMLKGPSAFNEDLAGAQLKETELCSRCDGETRVDIKG